VFYNQHGKAEQFIKEGKNAVKWTQLSCRTMRGNAVRLQLHALACKLVKIGVKIFAHARFANFPMAEVAVP